MLRPPPVPEITPGSRVTVRDGSWALLAVAAAMIVLLGIRKVWDPDAWWQLATGRWILQHGLSSAEVLSLRQRGTPRTESSWLYCVVLAWIVARAGLAGAIIVKSLLMLGGFASAAAAAIRHSPNQRIVVGTLTILAAIAASQRFVLRPEVVAYLLWGVFLLLTTDRRLREHWVVFAVVPLQALWANCHSSFPLGLVPLVAWLGERAMAGGDSTVWNRVRRPVMASGLAACACLLTPDPFASARVAWDHVAITLHGASSVSWPGGVAVGAVGTGSILVILCIVIRRWASADEDRRRVLTFGASLIVVAGSLGWLIVRTLRPPSGSDATVIGELTSPLHVRPGFVALQAYWVTAAAGLVSLVVRPHTRSGPWCWLGILTFGLSLLAVRHIPFFALTAIAWLGRGPGPSVTSRSPAPLSWKPVLSGVMTAFAAFQSWRILTDRFTAAQGDTNQFGLGIAQHCFPVQAGIWLEASRPSAGVFAPPEFGSYLLLHGLRPTVDTRWAAGALEDYLAAVKNPDAFKQVLTQPDIDAVVLKNEQVGAIAVLMHDPGWRIVLADAVSCVAIRGQTTDWRLDDSWFRDRQAELPTVDPLPGVFRRVVSAWPYHRTARFCELFGRSDYARYFDQQALSAWRSVGILTGGNTDGR